MCNASSVEAGDFRTVRALGLSGMTSSIMSLLGSDFGLRETVDTAVKKSPMARMCLRLLRGFVNGQKHFNMSTPSEALGPRACSTFNAANADNTDVIFNRAPSHLAINQPSSNMATEVASQPDVSLGMTGDRSRWYETWRLQHRSRLNPL